MTETTDAQPRLIELAVPAPVVAYRIVEVGTAPIRHTEPPAGIPNDAVEVAEAAAAPALTKIGVVDPFATTRSRSYSVDEVVYSAVEDEIPLVIVVKYETARATRLPYGVLLMRACGHRRYSVVGQYVLATARAAVAPAAGGVTDAGRANPPCAAVDAGDPV